LQQPGAQELQRLHLKKRHHSAEKVPVVQTFSPQRSGLAGTSVTCTNSAVLCHQCCAGDTPARAQGVHQDLGDMMVAERSGKQGVPDAKVAHESI
jgi:hypothetical protein